MFDSKDRRTLQTFSRPAFRSRPYTQLEDYPRSGRRSRSRVLWGVLACLVLLFVVGAIVLGNSPNYVPPIMAQEFPARVFFAIGAGIILVLVLAQGIVWRTPLRKPLLWSAGLLLLALVAVGWFWSAFVNPYVSMSRTSFLRNSVSLNNGETLHFQNPADGVTQILCIGVDQKCQPENGAPDALNHGIRVQPGQSVTITFNTDGDYHITSETTPGMNLSVDVSTPDDSGGY